MKPVADKDRVAVWTTRGVLVFLLVGMLLVGKSRKAWPIVAWSMYSSKVMEPAADTLTRVYLDVYLRDGRVERLPMQAFFPIGRAEVAQQIVTEAFAQEDTRHRVECRQAVVWMVAQVLHGERVESIEARRLVWRVDALANPPLNRDSPMEDQFVGRLQVTKEGGVVYP